VIHTSTSVTARRAAPLSHSERYAVFFDDDGKVGILTDPSLLDASSREILADEWRRSDLTAVVQRITSVKHDLELAHLSVQTDRGQRHLAIGNPEKNVRWLGDRHVLLVDIDGNRFDVPDVTMLDPHSARLLRQAL
jgi:hypothetical protein